MPKRTAIVVKCLHSGREYRYRSMQEAANKGGFEYTGVVNCVLGKQEAHSGHSFHRLEPAPYTPPPRVVEASKLHNEGLKVKEIAERMGILYKSASTLVVHGRKLGLINTPAKPQPWLMKTQNVESRINAS
ncbi:MAG: hypothetical protein ACRCXB_22955 [Aeromonadaceae bacterium]